MKNKIRVFIVDDSSNAVIDVKKYFSSHETIEIVDSCGNGKEALKMLKENHDNYDLIVTDLILPGCDGLTLLEEMKNNNIELKSIVITSINSNDIISKCINLGVNYYILKPCDNMMLEKRITDLFKNNSVVDDRSDIKQRITNLLHSLGIPSHIKGYSYIRDSVNLMYNNPKLMGCITKSLYPEIADRYETTSSRVERAIRHAIEVSWSRGDYDLMEDLFGHSVDYDRAKPTNSEFIATIADHLRLAV